MRWFIYFLLASCITVIDVSCSKNKDAKSLAETFCDCAQPIVKWKKGLEFNYEKMGEEAKVRMSVDSCLQNIKSKYAHKKEDADFKKEVSDLVKQQCPEANTTVNALFSLLFAEKEPTDE